MTHLGKVEQLDQFEAGLDMSLDAGIRDYVLALRSGGIETFESCQGGDGHAFTEPTVRFYGGMGEGFKAFGIARERGLPVFKVRLSYTAQEGMLHGPTWEMVFATPAHS